MTPAERALLNSQTMDGTRDRSLCGIELGPITLANRRYIERLVEKFSRMGYKMQEITFAYAYILTLDMPALRRAARDMDLFEIGMDAFMEKLPRPLPPGEMEKLSEIVDKDIAEIRASDFEVQAREGEAVDKDAPPNV